MILFDDWDACSDMDFLAAIAHQHSRDGYKYEVQQ